MLVTKKHALFVSPLRFPTFYNCVALRDDLVDYISKAFIYVLGFIRNSRIEITLNPLVIHACMFARGFSVCNE